MWRLLHRRLRAAIRRNGDVRLVARVVYQTAHQAARRLLPPRARFGIAITRAPRPLLFAAVLREREALPPRAVVFVVLRPVVLRAVVLRAVDLRPVVLRAVVLRPAFFRAVV